MSSGALDIEIFDYGENERQQCHFMHQPISKKKSSCCANNYMSDIPVIAPKSMGEFVIGPKIYWIEIVKG